MTTKSQDHKPPHRRWVYLGATGVILNIHRLRRYNRRRCSWPTWPKSKSTAPVVEPSQTAMPNMDTVVMSTIIVMGDRTHIHKLVPGLGFRTPLPGPVVLRSCMMVMVKANTEVIIPNGSVDFHKLVPGVGYCIPLVPVCS